MSSESLRAFLTAKSGENAALREKKKGDEI